METGLVVCEDKIRITTDRPEYIVEDKDYIKLIKDLDFRKRMLNALGKVVVVFGRLGESQSDGSFVARDLNKPFSTAKATVKSEMGYYAKVQ